MAYQWSAGDVRTTRQHRAATEPTPSKDSISAIPPSLIPGHRHHHTFSATGTNSLTNGLLYFSPSAGINPTIKGPTTAYITPRGDAQDYFSMNPFYRDFQPAPSPHLPQSLLPQSVGPPLPPKAPVINSPTTTP